MSNSRHTEQISVQCPCGFTYNTLVGALRIAWCDRCGTGATVPPPSRDVYGDGLFEDSAAGYGGARLAQQEQWLLEARIRLSWMRRRVPSGASILEIGAATGEFVATAEAAGYEVVGLETSPLAAAESQRLTANVSNSDLAHWRAANAGRTVDAAAMFHVLEHFERPAIFLRELREVLPSSGLLFLEVPNGGSRGARTQGPNWWAARTEDHFFHFTRRGLRALLSISGYRVLEMRAIHRDVYAGPSARRRAKRIAKDVVKTALARPGLSRDLLRAVAGRV